MNISVSTETFDSKPLDDYVKHLDYEPYTSCSIDDIASWISHGYALSANVKHEGLLIKQTDRTHENFKSIPFVFFDLDGDVKDDLETLCNKLKYKPTIAYTTYRHHMTDPIKGFLGNRYRLMYFFDEHIRDIATYKILYTNLLHELGFSVKDTCGCNPVQNIFGSNRCNQDFRLIKTYTTYDIDEVEAWGYSSIEYGSEESANTNRKAEGRSNYNSNCTFVKYKTKREKEVKLKDFITEFREASLSNMHYLINKYADDYDILECTPLPDGDEDIPYILLPDDFCEIYVPWRIEVVKDEYGDVTKRIPKIVRWKDGQGRKYNLFKNALRRRIMTNDAISFDNLLYSMMCEFYWYYESNGISLQTIYKKAEEAWDIDISLCKKKLTGVFRKVNGEYRRRKYVINPAYCRKYGVTAQQANGKAQGMLRGIDEKIEQLYDRNLTDKQNLEIFKANGLNVSLRTLKNWREKHGITKYSKKQT